MHVKVLFLAMICVPIYSSEGVIKPWSWQNLKTVVKHAREGQPISAAKSITQAPHYSPWSWQHLKNLVGLAVVSRPTAEALAATHRQKFKEKMLQDEVDELEKLVETSNPLWKNFESFDKHYEKVIKTNRPDRYVHPNLSPEWIKYADKALEERGINPQSIDLIQMDYPNLFASAMTNPVVSRPSYLRRLWSPPLDIDAMQLELGRNPSLKIPGNDNDREAIISHVTQHEATHFEQKHQLRGWKYYYYQRAQGKDMADASALVDAQEKTAETLPALKSRKDAANALTAHRHGVGYLETNPDIRIQKAYWDVLYFHEKKDELEKSAQQLQKKVQQHPVNTAIRQQSYNLTQRLRNVMPSSVTLSPISTFRRLPSKAGE